MKLSYAMGVLVLLLAFSVFWMSRNREDQAPVAQDIDAQVPSEARAHSLTPVQNIQPDEHNQATQSKESMQTSQPEPQREAEPMLEEIPIAGPAANSPSPQEQIQEPASNDIVKAKKQLQDARISDLSEMVGRSKAMENIKTPEGKGIQGSFSGQLEPSAYNKEPWQVETNIQVSEDQPGKFRSDYAISVQSASNGRFSNTTGNGILESVRTVENLSGILLQLSPTMTIHALYVPSSDALVGNFYSVDDKGKTLFHGPIILSRQ